MMAAISREQQIRHSVLEILDKYGTVANKVLYSRLEKQYPDLNACEYTEALDQLRSLELIHSFDGGYAKMHEITRKGVCALVDR